MASSRQNPSGFERNRHPDTFDRKIAADFQTIESRCEACGAVLSGTVSDGLPEREAKHYQECSKGRASSSASS